MDIAKLYDACQRSWDADTSYNEDYARTVRLTSAERSYGQCAVTSLVVDDHHPGQFFQATVRWKETSAIHYWISLSDLGEVDFTWDQFPAYAARSDIVRVARAQLLPTDNHWMLERYELFKARVTLLMLPEAASSLLSLTSPGASETAFLS